LKISEIIRLLEEHGTAWFTYAIFILEREIKK